jgi:putative nucleotidyltransferase with HDIG domain
VSAGGGSAGPGAVPGRAAALALLHEFTHGDSLRKHALAVEAVMRALARRAGADPELWGVVGLLHDFDYERWPAAADHPARGAEILRQRGWPEEIVLAIQSHATYTGVPRDRPLRRALFASDELVGFITAVALVRPHKRLAEVTPASVLKKLKDKNFARTVDRVLVQQGCDEMGVELEAHVQFCIDALLPAAEGLGLAGPPAPEP